jgi:hypothetical protein
MYQPKLDSEEAKLEVIRLSNEGVSNRSIAKMLGLGESSVRAFLNRSSYKDFWEVYDAGIVSGTNESPDCDHELDGDAYVITSAQNNTWVDRKFFESLLCYCEANDARLLVSTFHYNKNGFQNGKDEEVWYDPIIRPYIADFPAKLADDLLYCGELNILPTAVTPLSGLGTYTKNASGIVPHAKVQLESQPRQKGQDPRFLYTTGAVTVRNYIDMKAGQKASFHHVVGALVVEIDEEGDWFVRQVTADENGGFYDLDTYYSPDGITEGCSAKGITWGDIHAEDIDPQVKKGMFDSDGILDTLRPEYQFMHDLVSFRARNHHNRNDPYFRFKSFVEGSDSVVSDIEEGVIVLTDSWRPWSRQVVVASNHDQALVRWLKETDYRNDPKNAVFFLEMQLAVYKAMENREGINILEHAIKILAKKEYGISFEDVEFIEEDESFKLFTERSPIECGNHGHLGNNGARGSLKSFAKLGVKQNVGHSHTCGIFDSAYQSGTSTYMDLGYNKGPSSWSHSHIIVYNNGKRAIITQRGGKWKA